MKMSKYPRDLEFVTRKGEIRRLMVPGGWIVLSQTHRIEYDKFVSYSESMAFVKDEEHTWNLEEK